MIFAFQLKKNQDINQKALKFKIMKVEENEN
jgi:hypothetical protein